eukprot:TRINITY_DN3634_c0_g1_i1.p1 TRINITY_DN3634_c0_g1~~TRINITY_DN3634_c0_g1_i1.p1  ORF type:complete len:101 (-),score=1.10 TRINITY_DN3634_c0_g1_i1:7-309(-)
MQENKFKKHTTLPPRDKITITARGTRLPSPQPQTMYRGHSFKIGGQSKKKKQVIDTYTDTYTCDDEHKIRNAGEPKQEDDLPRTSGSDSKQARDDRIRFH